MVRFLATHMAVGVGAGWTVLAGLLWIDVGGVRTLALNSPDGPLALGLLAFFFALTFGSVGMGAGAMSLWRTEGRGTGGGRQVCANLTPARVRVKAVIPNRTKPNAP